MIENDDADGIAFRVGAVVADPVRGAGHGDRG
jgi:hypothetical protein